MDEKRQQQLDNSYNQIAIGKNLLVPEDFLYGWTYSSDDGLIQKSDGILSNRLYLKLGGTYTVQNISPYERFNRTRIVFFNNKDQVVDNISIDYPSASNLVGSFMIRSTPARYYATYARLVLQFTSTKPFNINVGQIEFGNTATAHEFPKTLDVKKSIDGGQDRLAFLTGASNAMCSSGWFEYACNKLGIKDRNVAVSGQTVMGAADLAWRGELYTPQELEDMDYFITSHTHNYNVAYENPLSTILQETVADYESKGYDSSGNPLTVPLDKNNPNHHIVPQLGGFGASGPYSENTEAQAAFERYSAGYDYLLKKYVLDCYNLRSNPNSKYYGTKMGKPVRIIICSYWHDGYKRFNTSAEKLARKFGATFCNIADNVGLSYRQTNPSDPNSIRQSALYCFGSQFGDSGDIEDIPIDRVKYTNMGWHVTRDYTLEFNQRRGDILVNAMLYGNPVTVIKESVDSINDKLNTIIDKLLYKLPKVKIC